MKLSKVTFVSPIEAPDGGSGIHRKDFSEPGYEIESYDNCVVVTHRASRGCVATNIPFFGVPKTVAEVHAEETDRAELRAALKSGDRFKAETIISDMEIRQRNAEAITRADAVDKVADAAALSEPFSDPSDTQTGTPKAKRGRPPKSPA